MTNKRTPLKDADKRLKVKGQLGKAKPRVQKQNEPQKSDTLPEYRKDIPTVPVTQDDLARPLHTVVSKFQHEAVKTLVHLMRHAQSETVRQKSATEILALGGNDSQMLKLQAVMTGKNKDVSQMSVEELESFLQNAKHTLDNRLDAAANKAVIVTESTVESEPRGVGGVCKDSLKATDSPADTWL